MAENLQTGTGVGTSPDQSFSEELALSGAISNLKSKFPIGTTLSFEILSKKTVQLPANNYYETTVVVQLIAGSVSTPPATPPPTQSPPPPKPATIPDPPPSKKGVYYPETKYSKPKAAGPEEFVVKKTKQYHKGSFVKTFDNKYFAGSSPMETGIELQKVKEHNRLLDEGLPQLYNVLAGAVGGFHKKQPTKSELQNGVTKRYFVQDLNDNKIVETDKVTYAQTKLQVPNRNFAQIDWIIKGPAEDQMFGQYPFEGAASKNKKTIQALEKQIPGISTFVTDYKYLVTEPVYAEQHKMTTQTFIEKDHNQQVQEDRKANFDYRK